MGQYEILKILEKEPEKWFSARELEKITQVGRTSVRENLRRLLHSNEIERREGKRGWYNIYEFKFKTPRKE
jgi:DNA-binding GntR family transcriptional regulator